MKDPAIPILILYISYYALYEHEYCYLCAVNDVSAQTSCAVISPNLTTLTIRDGLQRDVELHCQCMDGNGMMITGTRWFHNGSLVATQNAITSSVTAPYQINTIPITLYINLPFTTNSFHTGAYTCSPNSMFSASPPGDTITLNAGSEYVASYIYENDTQLSTVYSNIVTSM